MTVYNYLFGFFMALSYFDRVKKMLKDSKATKTDQTIFFLHMFFVSSFFVVSLISFSNYKNNIELIIFSISILTQFFSLGYVFLHLKSVLNLFYKTY